MSASAILHFLGSAIGNLNGKLFWFAIPLGWIGWQIGWRRLDARLMMIPVALLFASMLILLFHDDGPGWIMLFVATMETLTSGASMAGFFAVGRLMRREFAGIGSIPRPASVPRPPATPSRRAVPAIGLYRQIRRNSFKSLALFAVFILMVELLAFCLIAAISARNGDITGVLSFQDVETNVIQAWRSGLWLLPPTGALVWLWVAWLFYRPALQRAFDATPLQQRDWPQLFYQVQVLAIASGLPTPKIVVVDSESCNAFAAGFSPETAIIGVTRGLLQKLDRHELEAVLAHEMTHIANRDIRLMAVATLCTGIVFRMAWVLVLHNLKPGLRFLLLACCGAFFIWQVIALVAWACVAAGVCALMTKLAISRAREFLADAGAVELTSNPQALISALQKISGGDDIAGLDYACKAMMFSPVGAQSFSPHPTLDERIAALRAALPAMFDAEPQEPQAMVGETPPPGVLARAIAFLPDLSFLRSLATRQAFYADVAALKPPTWVSRPSILLPTVLINLALLAGYATLFDPALLRWRPTPMQHPEIERVHTPGANICFPSDMRAASAPKPFTPIVFDIAKSHAGTYSAEEEAIYRAWYHRHEFAHARERCPISNECSGVSRKIYLGVLEDYVAWRRKATEQLNRDYGAPGLAFAQNFFDTPLDRDIIADLRMRLATRQINLDKFDLANVAALDLILTKPVAAFAPCPVGAASVEPAREAHLTIPQASLGACRFQIPHDAVAIRYDAFGGGARSNYRLAAEPGAYLGRAPITIPKRDAPVYVILSSYGPTEWDLKIEPGARIAAVLAVGFRSQIVSNVPPQTEVAFSTVEDGAGEGCPALTFEDPIAQFQPVLPGSGQLVDEHYREGPDTCAMIACISARDSMSGARPPATPASLVRTSANLVSADDAPEDRMDRLHRLMREMQVKAKLIAPPGGAGASATPPTPWAHLDPENH